MPARHEFRIDARGDAVAYRNERRVPAEVREKMKARIALGYTNPNVVPDAERDNLASRVTHFRAALANENVRKRPSQGEVARLKGLLSAATNAERLALDGSAPQAPRQGYMAMAGFLALAAMGGAIAAGNQLGNSVGGWLVAILILVVGLAAAARLANWSASDPIALTPEDRQAIEDATETLYLPAAKPVHELTRSTTDFRVGALMACVLDLRNRITGSVSWSSTYLDAHRVRFNPAEEAHEIIGHAIDLHVVATSLGAPPTGQSATATTARRAFNATREPLGVVWSSLVARVAALQSYCLHIELLDIELDNAAVAKRTLGLNDEIGQLLANAVGDEFAAAHMQRLTCETKGLTAGVNELVAALNGDLNTLKALAAVPT